jgi:lysophospholipase L1-like esterase
MMKRFVLMFAALGLLFACTPENNGESSTADGIHPNDNGYSIWARSIEKPILKILRKYGIK